MTALSIELFIGTKPFRPFVLFLADGRSLAVSSADWLTFGTDGRSLFVFLPGSNESELVDLNLVVSARFSETRATVVQA